MDINQNTDEELVEIVRSSNKEAYIELVKRYEKKLFRYVMTIMNNEANAADVTQDTFIKAYENLQGFDTKLKFSSWIYRIAHNTALNAVRKHNKLVFDWEFSLMEGNSMDNPEESFDKEDLAREIKEHLESIPLKYREVLTLYYIEEKSYEDISDILRIPLGTVGTRMNRGRKVLKKKLKESI